MAFSLKIGTVVAGSALAILSLAWAGPAPEAEDSLTMKETTPYPSDKNPDSLSQGMNVVSEAIKYRGIPYRWGGTSPITGFDCSGFVQFIFRHALNIQLPRLPVHMIQRGERINRDELAPGDLVFFNTRGGKFTHVGIYVDDEQFIHAPMPGTRVTMSRMDSAYYRNRFTYAVRIRTK